MKLLLDKNLSFRLGGMLEALDAAGDQLREGAIVAVGRENVRVRRFPIR